MTKTKENKEELMDDLNELESEIDEIEENEDTVENEELNDRSSNDPEDEKCKDILTRTIADFENFKMRSERDREDMIFFLKSDILKKVLPRLDDLDRIIKSTPKEEQKTAIFEAVLAIHKKLTKDLEQMWVTAFDSIWEEPNPDMHEIMTQIPWWEEWKIVDEFEKWYKLWDKVLRVSKVVVGLWE